MGERLPGERGRDLDFFAKMRRQRANRPFEDPRQFLVPVKAHPDDLPAHQVAPELRAGRSGKLFGGDPWNEKIELKQYGPDRCVSL